MKFNPMKNIITFRAELPTAEALATHLLELPFTELEENDFSRSGFVANPFTQELVSTFEGGYSVCLQHDEKILPAAAVKSEVDKRVAAIEEADGRPVHRKERQQIKDMVLGELVKRALFRSTLIYAYYHIESRHLFVVTSSKEHSQKLVHALLKCVGSIKTETINVTDVKHGLTTRLTALINGGQERDTFGEFGVGDSCKLVRKIGGEDKETINYTGVLIGECEELLTRLDSGFGVESLALSIQGLSFKLNHDFQMKSLAWAEDEDAEHDEDLVQAWMDDAAVKVFILNHASNLLTKMLEYREEDANNEPSAADPQAGSPTTIGEEDLYEQAVALVRKENRASVSMIQRSMLIDYVSASTLIDNMIKNGVVGEPNSNGIREVINREA